MSALLINSARLCAVIIISVIFLGIQTYSQPTAFAQGELPPRPGDPLPPRPEVPLPPHPKHDDNGSSSFTQGAFIKLSIWHGAGRWSVVQWQDGMGQWHDVGGWQGMLDPAGEILWFVETNDFGKGPFRWVLNGASGQQSQEVSNAFFLPTGIDQVVTVSGLQAAHRPHAQPQPYRPPAQPQPYQHHSYQQQPAIVHHGQPQYGHHGNTNPHYRQQQHYAPPPAYHAPPPPQHYAPARQEYHGSAHGAMQNGCYTGPEGHHCPPSY